MTGGRLGPFDPEPFDEDVFGDRLGYRERPESGERTHHTIFDREGAGRINAVHQQFQR